MLDRLSAVGKNKARGTAAQIIVFYLSGDEELSLIFSSFLVNIQKQLSKILHISNIQRIT